MLRTLSILNILATLEDERLAEEYGDLLVEAISAEFEQRTLRDEKLSSFLDSIKVRTLAQRMRSS